MSGIELKPCPFCGGEAEIRTSEPEIDARSANYYIKTSVWVRCKKCLFARESFTAYVRLDDKNMETKGSLSDDQGFKHVVNQWNRRAGDGFEK